MSVRRKFSVRLLIVLLVVFVILFTPYKSTTSPRWLVQVVDVEGNPVRDFPVKLQWSYFGIDLAPMVESKRTDSRGQVEFQRKTTWASLAARLSNFQGSAKPGPAVWVEACDNHSLLGEFFWDGNRFVLEPSPSPAVRIIVKPSTHCTFT